MIMSWTFNHYTNSTLNLHMEDASIYKHLYRYIIHFTYVYTFRCNTALNVWMWQRSEETKDRY